MGRVVVFFERLGVRVLVILVLAFKIFVGYLVLLFGVFVGFLVRLFGVFVLGYLWGF